MRRHFNSKFWAPPQPVYIIGMYDENGKAVATKSLHGVLCDGDKVCLFLDDDKIKTQTLLKNGEFSLSIVSSDYIGLCDYLDSEMGQKTFNVVEEYQLHVQRAEDANAPIFSEFPMAAICKLMTYDKETGLLFGKIKYTSIDEDAIPNGDMNVAYADPITIDPVSHEYVRYYEVIHNAFKDSMPIKADHPDILD